MNITHFDYFLKIKRLVEENLIVYRQNYEITGAYIHNEDEFRLLAEYFEIGHTYSGRITIDNNYFRGEPDWYFLDGEDGSQEWPSTWNFKTLTETKKEFENFCKMLEELKDHPIGKYLH